VRRRGGLARRRLELTGESEQESGQGEGDDAHRDPHHHLTVAPARGGRLEPYEKFAHMIERHWNGIAAYCHRENKVSLGFVEGLNNKIRVIQRRAYGLRDEEYLRLKILTCMLPEI